MPTLADRIFKLERDRRAVSPAELDAAMEQAAARLAAKLRGDEALPPEPPEWLLAELGRHVTPADLEDANAKLLRMLERRSQRAQGMDDRATV